MKKLHMANIQRCSGKNCQKRTHISVHDFFVRVKTSNHNFCTQRRQAGVLCLYALYSDGIIVLGFFLTVTIKLLK